MNLASIRPDAAGAATSSASVAPQQAAQRQQLIKAADILNAGQTFGDNNELIFVFDRTTHRPIMRVVDRKTNDVIMQLPPEYVLNLAAEVQAEDRRKQGLQAEG